jgi:hypothetical protein
MGYKKEPVNEAKGYVEVWTPDNEKELLDEKIDYATRMMQESPRSIKSLFSNRINEVADSK